MLNSNAVRDYFEAKQRACMKWILSKAYNNRVPDNLKEPFYRDHEGKEHLQSSIVVGLGNASLYCQVLANLYSDPNYQNRNHFSILQTLSRKGVHCHEVGDVQLTETVLIQTNPLKINAHMSVIEALMVLYAKEIASGDRVASAIARITGAQLADSKNYEQAFLYWVSYVCAALKKRIEQELEIDGLDENGQRLQVPDIPPLRDYKDLCDGVCLAYLISFYCPKIVPWTSVRIKYLPIVEDSIHNVLLVSNFSQKYLPYSVFHMTPEDISYMRGTMKQNLLVLLADLFNLFEIHPAKCVCYPEMEQQVVRSPSGTQLKRPTPPREAPDQSVDDGFIVHRSRGVPTLSSMNEPLIPARIRQAKEKSNNDSKADERGDSIPAGRPSNWGDQRHNTFSGRRSRRNSFSEDSQLTIENFGGSQDQINMIGRFDRGASNDRERRVSNTSAPAPMNYPLEQLQPVRSSLSDARSTLQLGYGSDGSGSEKQDRDDEKTTMGRRRPSVESVSASRNATMRQHSRDNIDGEISRVKQMATTYGNSNDYEKPSPGKMSFAQLSNPTTWQQQTVHHQHSDDIDDVQPYVDASKLSTIRLKLEEKRRHIEQEKRKLEAAVSKYQQKVGKAAFLQAINKGKGEGTSQEESRASKDSSLSSNKTEDSNASSSSKPERPCSLQDITGDPMESRWDMQFDTKKTPDLDQMDIEQYTQSIAMMNTNLTDIQSDIQRLASQQSQIQAQTIQAQQLMHAQQIANILSQQQQYGSQHNINTTGYRPLNSSFGSSPHLSQSPQYNTRPPSRDQHIIQQNVQYVNDQGQYIQNQSQSSYPQVVQGNHPMYARENSQTQIIQNNQYANQQYQQPYHQDSNHYRDMYGGYQQEQQQQQQQQVSNNTFYLHDQQSQVQTPPQPTQRRTWAQSAQMQQQRAQQEQQQQPEMTTWSSHNSQNKIDTRTWKSPSNNSSNESSKGNGGFMLHQNGGNNHEYSNPEQSYQNLFPVHANSPQHRQHRQISQILSNEYNRVDNRMQMTPPDDVMAPQSISFIADDDGDETEEIPVSNSKPVVRPRTAPFNQHQVHHEPENSTKLELNLAKLNITSGNRTYRIPSPTRPAINPNSFQNPQEDTSEKGFYISFDNEQPKRPKPPLRTKRSPKKDKELQNYSNNSSEKEQIEEPMVPRRNFGSHHASPPPNSQYIQQPPVPADRRHLEDVTNQSSQMNNIYHNNYQQNQNNNNNAPKESKALIIGPDSNLDPNSMDEMERKKEKIMLLSLQRRQQQEEAKARKEIEAMTRREREREKEDERARKKEEQAARRAAILEQHKLKKAIEEAEREGKTLDKSDLMLQQKLQQTMPKLRPQKVVRPRPKTIHVESGSVDLSEASSMSSRGKRGSNTNLTGVGMQNSNSNSNTMRRDYYRGSQDSLAMRESPDEYPSSSSTTPIGRRGSYKTGREPVAERGRTLSRIQIAKAGANFRGRKSNSLMNLCDSDSGLGRATPPRRAPSPGMGARHLPSPSGPGSLPPGLMTKRRIFDDGSSDISSAASSMLEYSGPRLYKQPATKSNRGIILNAVEYCVFPGAVNREAKQKVLEKIARAEAKHFLILFRDAGCQFRALYSYYPDNEQIIKLYGTGPSQVDDVMFDKFFKYNSGGKCFAQVHTKHLTVTIDAFTIHNSLWQGKKVALPSKKDMALVI
uniref:CSON005804 protein n=1 Tax=Culicoides sonorensis TaxID=179676 RepID=A0A336MXI7_CULSO